MEKKLLRYLLEGDLVTEDDILKALNIDEEKLEELFESLEKEGYLEVDNGYFDMECENCKKGGMCKSDKYTPNERVKKIRVITEKGLREGKNL